MRVSFQVTYALYRGECLLSGAFKDAVKHQALEPRGDELVGRFFGVRMSRDGRALEGCLRVSYKQRGLLVMLLEELRRRKIPSRVVYKSKGNVVLQFKHSRVCSFCPLIHATEGFVPKTMLATPLGLLLEFVSQRKHHLDSNLFEVLVSGRADEMMDYMLTPREQEILHYAYSRGYFSQPRGATLNQIAAELGMSKSALSEVLRSAIGKVVTAYMRHDLPHLIVARILERRCATVKTDDKE